VGQPGIKAVLVPLAEKVVPVASQKQFETEEQHAARIKRRGQLQAPKD